jgi:tetratricopeptide (TPR) repeat protein
VISKYPDSKQAKQAYEALANMYDQDMHDYSNAVKAYDAIVARYRDDPVVLRSLQAQALIYQNKTNQPLEAIAAYKKLADLFKGKDGLAALLQAEKLAQYTVADWKLSIDINERIINSYPDSEEAPKALYANAAIYDGKLKDSEQALKLYQLFVEHYPGHSLAGQARQRIKALQPQPQQKPQPAPAP